MEKETDQTPSAVEHLIQLKRKEDVSKRFELSLQLVYQLFAIVEAQHRGWCDDAYIQGAIADGRLDIDSMLHIC